jgi:uncharacterized membrane protein YjfL (UPF0719 family)
MSDQFFLIFNSFPLGLIYISLAIIILVIAKISKDILTPYKIDEELTQKDNPALGLSITGYYIGVLIIFMGIVYHPDNASPDHVIIWSVIFKDILFTLFYSLLGVLFLNIAHRIVDKLILRKFSTEKEIIQDRNVGTGAVEFGNYVSAGMVIAGALNGESGGPWWFGMITASVFFVASQALLVLFTFFYQLIARYDIHAEIEKDNVSAGVALGGNMIALSIIIFNSIVGNFPGWDVAFVNLLTWSGAGLMIIFVFRLLIDLFFIPNATISEEIARDRNINAAYIESAILIGISVIITLIL